MPAFALAPETPGLARLIDHRMLELAVAELRHHTGSRLTVNLSAATIADQDWLTSLGLPLHCDHVAQRLIVAITESAAIADPRAMHRLAGTLKDYGVRVMIDDFGAGHISFRALRDLDVDMVRIDGAFTQAMAHSADNRFLVRTLIDLARDLDLETVAEWVQDEATAAQLTGWGCRYLQGALIGRTELHKPWSMMRAATALAG
jgi:EAL domain-containing protein (putative c-di-GMP-specific phosphodiesterase class I)